MEMGLTIDVDEDPKGTKMDCSDVPRKTQKRKSVCSSSSSTVAALMEETELPLSKLAEEIHQKLKDGMSAATVKNSVLKFGQRVMYGVPNVEADVLQDQSQTCL